MAVLTPQARKRLSFRAEPRPPPGRESARATSADEAYATTSRLERAVRRRRRPADRRAGPDRQRRRHPGLRRPARDRAAGRGRLHARRGHPDRHAQRRDLPRPRRPHRLDRARQERRPGRDRRRPVAADRRYRERRNRVQGRRRLRSGVAARLRPRALRAILNACRGETAKRAI